MRHEDQPFWRTTWNGDAVEGGEYDERTPTLTDSPGKTARAMVWGVSVPWTLVLSAVLGFWLVFSPTVFGIGGAAADGDHLVGAIVLTISVIVMAEGIRAGVS